MLLYYVRHGDPIYDPDSLTELGHKQAKALAKRFQLYGLDEIYVSSSNRARQTAQPTCEALGIKPVILDWANEGHAARDFFVKQQNGKNEWLFRSKEYKGDLLAPEVTALGKKWYEDERFKNYSFKEGVLRVERETDKFLSSLGYVHEPDKSRYKIVKKNDKRIAFFAHQGFGISFLSALLDIPYPTFGVHFELSHSSVTPILFDGEEGEYAYAMVLQLSNDSHLYKENLLTGYNNGIKV